MPFYIFCHEEELETLNQNSEKLEKVKEEYRRIKEHLNKLQEDGRLNEQEKSVIISMTKKVVRNLAAKYKNVKKGVDDIMGGRVLVHEAYVLTEKGRAMERKNTEAEKQRADEAEKSVKAEKQRADEAEERVKAEKRRADEAEQALEQLKKILEKNGCH